MTLTSQLHREPQPCIILDLRCINCGSVRVVIRQSHKPPQMRRCPCCGARTPTRLLGSGHTVRELPFWGRGEDAEALDNVIVFSDKMPAVWPNGPNRKGWKCPV
jgi:hypothetical protein